MVIIIAAIVIALLGIGRIASGYCAGSGVGMIMFSGCLVLSGCGVIDLPL